MIEYMYDLGGCPNHHIANALKYGLLAFDKSRGVRQPNAVRQNGHRSTHTNTRSDNETKHVHTYHAMCCTHFQSLARVKTGEGLKGAKPRITGEMDVGRIIAQVITAIEPLLVKTVVSVTETAVAQMCESYATQAEVNKLRSEVQVLKFDLGP